MDNIRTRRILETVHRLTVAFAIVLALGPVLLLLVSETWRGRLFAVGTLAGIFSITRVAPVLIDSSRRSIVRCAATAGAAIACLVFCRLLGPPTEPELGAALTSVIISGRRPTVWSPAQLVPELDQFKLGGWLLPLVDPLIDWSGSGRVVGHFKSVYHEMYEDPQFRKLPSAMPIAYRDLFDTSNPAEHYFVFRPPGSVANGAKLPVLLFLHGWLGNFQAYTWILSRVAIARQCAVVAPSYGFGYWFQEDHGNIRGGVTAIRQALQFIEVHSDFDPGRVYLAGLSNGGFGVTKGALSFAHAFRGLIYISPVLEPDQVRLPAFLRDWKERPVLVLHGAADNRIPLHHVQEGVDAMKAGGVDVSFITFPEAEHWLMFSHRTEVAKTIDQWLEKAEARR